jgi:Na+-translocating ferredoxin:NAD+ oxidoreductase RnfD subunit
MGRLEDAADHAGRLCRGGRVRFYVALVMLGVLTVAFAAVAVVNGRAGVADGDEAVVTGLIGAVACPAIAAWGVHRFSRGQPPAGHDQ